MRMVNTKIDRLHRLDRPDRLHRLDRLYRLYSFWVYGSMAGLWRVYFDRPGESFTGVLYSDRVYGVYQVYGFVQNEQFREKSTNPVYGPGLSGVYESL